MKESLIIKVYDLKDDIIEKISYRDVSSRIIGFFHVLNLKV